MFTFGKPGKQLIKNDLPLSKVESDPVVLLVHWQGKSQSGKQIVNVGVCVHLKMAMFWLKLTNGKSALV